MEIFIARGKSLGCREISAYKKAKKKKKKKKIQQWQKSGWGKPHAFSHGTVVTLSSSILRSQSFLESSRKMERSRSCRVLPPLTCYAFCRLLSSLCLILLDSQRANAYQNYTVGDSLGWYDRLQVPQVNYQKWVSGKNFSLGDFLVFNTDKGHTVVQTYNVTTYKRCNYNDAETDDTIEWSAGAPKFSKEKVTIAVPLLKEGMTYFFSGNNDGRQCRHGQHFKINVTHGQGLPESLKHHAEAPAPAAPEKGGVVPGEAVPSVPSSFSNPVQAGSVEASSAAGESLARMLRKQQRGWRFHLGLSLLGCLLVHG